MSGEVYENVAARRFEMRVDGATAFVEYRRSGHIVTLTHTEVPQSLSGHGLGSRIARGALELLRKAGAQIIAECPFMAEYVNKHPEFRGMLASGGGSRLDERLDEALKETFPASDPTAVSPRR
jgi:predicted GNAT family acetyltransferase